MILPFTSMNELIESVSQVGQRGSLHHHVHHQHRVVHQTRSGGAYWDDFMLEVRLTVALWQKWVQHGAYFTSTACIFSRWQHTPLSQHAPQHGVVTQCPAQGVPRLCGVWLQWYGLRRPAWDPSTRAVSCCGTLQHCALATRQSRLPCCPCWPCMVQCLPIWGPSCWQPCMHWPPSPPLWLPH